MIRVRLPPASPPPLRRRLRRTAAVLRRLHRGLLLAFPTGALLHRQPHLHEHIDSSPADLEAAAALDALAALLVALAALADPAPFLEVDDRDAPPTVF